MPELVMMESTVAAIGNRARMTGTLGSATRGCQGLLDSLQPCSKTNEGTYKRIMYQVKFEVDGETRFGVVNKFAEKAKVLSDEQIMIDDAIDLNFYVLDKTDVSEVSLEEYPNEYRRFIDAEYDKAKQISDRIIGIGVGKIFSLPVADGQAFYIVTKLNTQEAWVQWRGYDIDRYYAPGFGYGGNFDRKRISDLIRSEERIKRLTAS